MWDIELEHAKSKGLLQKMLPEHIISRLQDGQGMQLDYFQNVTILFSDIVNYTVLAGSAPSEQVSASARTMTKRSDVASSATWELTFCARACGRLSK